MNLSRLITRIKMKLGIYTIALPVEDLDGYITKIIQDITIPVFSTYYPYYEKLDINTSKLECVFNGPDYQTFLLPDYKTKKLLYVEHVEYSQLSVSGIGYLGGYIPAYYTMGVTQGMMLAQAEASFINRVCPAITFRYDPPRKLTIYNNILSTSVTITLAFEHDRNLVTIPETAAESFYKLAILDVMDNLFEIAKHYNEIESSYGRITLRIDDWQNADDNRKALLEDWDNSYHMDLPDQLIFR